MSQVGMGDYVRDRVTGYEGYVTAKVEYIDGSCEAAVLPSAKNNEYSKVQYINEQRLESLPDKGLAQPPTQKRFGFQYHDGGKA